MVNFVMCVFITTCGKVCVFKKKQKKVRKRIWKNWKETLCTVGRTINWGSFCGNQFNSSLKDYTELPYDSPNFTSSIYTKDLKAGT